MALRVLPRLIYGEKHAYGTPLTGSGTAASVSKLTRDDAARFHATWFKPNNATLVVVGDTTLAEIQPQARAALRLAGRRATCRRRTWAAVSAATRSAVYLLDRPGALQSVILAGHAAPPRKQPAGDRHRDDEQRPRRRSSAPAST